MGLESTINTIADLNVTWPTDGDVASQGDNHLRLIKDAVKKTFPNISAIVTPTAADLNTRLIPSGFIGMWSGSIASIPTGWFLCNGSNGTPNLIDRFVVCAGSAYTVGAMGGAATVALTQAQTPAHTHTFSGTTSGVSDDHSHSGWTGGMNQNTSHAHRMYEQSGPSGGNTSPSFSDIDISSNVYGPKDTSSVNLDHSHYITTGGASANHTHTYSGTTSSIGSGSAHENRPPYYALAYIMKS